MDHELEALVERIAALIDPEGWHSEDARRIARAILAELPQHTGAAEVEQVDRDFGADIWRDYVAKVGEVMVEKSMREGKLDDSLPSLVARHRAAGFAAGAVEGAKAMREVATDVGASLAATISLLERGGKAAKKAAPSDKMFDQMLVDYKASLDRLRAALDPAQIAGGKPDA